MKTSDRIKYLQELKKQQRRKQKQASYYKRKTELKAERDENGATEGKCVSDSALRKRKQRQKRKNRNEKQRKWRANTKNCINRETFRITPKSPKFKNKLQKSRALSKFKKSLPRSTPTKVVTLSAYLQRDQSPTVKGLQTSGIIVTPEDKEIISLGTSVLKDIASSIEQVKYKRTDDSRKTMNIISASFSGESVEKLKSKTKLARRLNISKRRIFEGARRNKIYKSEKAAYTFTERKTRSDALAVDVRKTIYDFWCSSDNSRPTGNKVDVKRVRIGPKTYSSHAVHILEKTQLEVYSDFRKKYPEIKVSIRLFEKCKPYFVRPARIKDRTTCCCRYHIEARSVFKACMDYRKTLKPLDEEKFPIYQSLSDAVAVTLCEKNDHSLSRRECLERECLKCGVSSLQFHEQELSIDDNLPNVKWEKYEYRNIETKHGAKRKLMLIQKESKPGEMFSYFKTLLEHYAGHQFRANWQNDQLKSLIQNLPINQCICVHDFSENYRCIDKAEIQSNYFQKTEVSIHVTLIYRHAVLEVDGVCSSETNQHIIGEQLFVISPDSVHDKHFTRRAQTEVADYLKSINCKCTVMHEFCDGCQCQYKSRHCLGDLTASVNDLGYECLYRNFFETSHAKGPQDAAGGLVKHQADFSVTRGLCKIQSARDLYAFAEKHLQQTKSSKFTRRIFRFVDEIDRNVVGCYNVVSENRKIHQVKATSYSDTLTIRDSSCYACDKCMDGDINQCENSYSIGHVRDVQMSRIRSENAIDNEDDDNDLSDCIRSGSVVALLSGQDTEEFYLMKFDRKETLNSQEQDFWGACYGVGTAVLKGLYFEKTDTCHYKLIRKKNAMVPVQSLLYILSDFKLEKSKLTISEEELQNIVDCVEMCDVVRS